MKKTTIIILASLANIITPFLIFIVFMYFFTKPAKPIMEYEFPDMTYGQLEANISKISNNKINSKFNLTQKELLNKKNSNIRKIILGKDSLQFEFITKMDKGYEFKTKDRHPKNSLPWLELIGACDSKGKFNGMNYKNKEKYSQDIILFENDFIKKINNGKINVIERGFWDWF